MTRGTPTLEIVSTTIGGPPPKTTIAARPPIRRTLLSLVGAFALLALAAACGRGRGASRDSAAPLEGGPVDTGALRSGVPHPRPRPRRPGEMVPIDTALGTEQPMDLPSDGVGPDTVTPIPPETPQPVPPPATAQGGVRVMPWELLTPTGIAQLRAVAAREERFFDEHGAYGSVGVGAREGWTVRLLSADARGWSAEATQSFYPGRSCVIWSGVVDEQPATRERGRRGGAGEAVCD